VARRYVLLLQLGWMCFLACSASDPLAAGTGTLGDRTYTLKVPVGYDGSHPVPLIVAMHGYGGSGAGEEDYFALDSLADAKGFLVLYPDGSVDPTGRRFFRATDACCDFYASGVDDVAFVAALLDRVESTYSVDPARVYAVGHSNGGFMSYRLACDLSTRFAAIVSLEGAMWAVPANCRPTSPVAVLEVHGTDDSIIKMAGGDVVDGYTNRIYPAVAQTVASWAALDGCASSSHEGVDPGRIDGETAEKVDVQTWDDCAADVTLWLIRGGTHVPTLTAAWPTAVYDFLAAHPKAP
jgi:polyhydroxybutyrate depolymerase